MARPDPEGNPPHTPPEPGAAHRVRPSPRKRPFGVTLLLWLVLSLSAWGLLRLAGALRWWKVLFENDAGLSPLYLSITGASWLLIGIVLLWSVFSIQRWAYIGIPTALLLWLLEYWIERTFFQGPRSNLTFAILASMLSLIITTLIAFHRPTKKYLTKSEEHE